MYAKVALCALGIVGFIAVQTHAQQRQTQTEEIRRQIELLNSQLTALERTEQEDRHVTQIGSARRTKRDPLAQVVRIYDLGDLFAVAPPYVAQHHSDLSDDKRSLFPSAEEGQANSVGFGGGGGGGFFSVFGAGGKLPDRSQQLLMQAGESGSGLGGARTTIDDLIKAITTTISPDEWDVVEGGGSIAKVGNSLLISATEGTHAQIDALLSLFRKRWGTLRTVTLRAYWLWLDEAQLSALVDVPIDGNDPLAVAHGAARPDAWQQHLTQLRGAENKRPPGYRAAITCYNGQTVHTVAGAQRLVITELIPTWVGKEEGEEVATGVGYESVVRMVQEGAALQVTPLTNTSGKFVVLDLHSRVATFREPDQQPAAEEKPAGQPADKSQAVVTSIERRPLMIQRISTTLRVPVEVPMLVGGMTFESNPSATDPNLYLFVKVAVQELRDDVAKAEGGENPEDQAPEKPKAKPPEPGEE